MAFGSFWQFLTASDNLWQLMIAYDSLSAYDSFWLPSGLSSSQGLRRACYSRIPRINSTWTLRCLEPEIRCSMTSSISYSGDLQLLGVLMSVSLHHLSFLSLEVWKLFSRKLKLRITSAVTGVVDVLMCWCCFHWLAERTDKSLVDLKLHPEGWCVVFHWLAERTDKVDWFSLLK